MSGQNSKNLSISFRIDDGVIGHNNRDFLAKNIDGERTGDNIIYAQKDIREMYNELFGQALAEYNARQTQASRKIKDYYDHIKNMAKGKPSYEAVVQFGDLESCGLKSGNWETAKQMLDEYMRGFEKRNPNLKVFNAVMHLDEATPHLHIDFIPIARKVKSGLSVKVSMKGALKEQGFTSANRLQNEWAAWEETERKAMIEILHAHDLSRNVKNVRREHLTVDEYKIHAAQKAEIRKTNEHINALKKKNNSDLTLEEAELIKNQNDILRSELQKRDEKILSLSRKIGAKFIPFDIYSEEKLQFVAAELTRANIPFVEENNTLHIPDYAQKTAAAIAASFRPTRVEGIRNNIRLDIDRLVYCSVSLEDLFDKLRERGYEIKQGKYIAVKPQNAERFVRLKTLGNAYILKNLEQRIAERDKFPNAVLEKHKTANEFEKQIHVTIMNMMIEVKQFRLAPRKIDPNKIYAFQNDANIEYLSKQLITLRDFNLGSREKIYSKAEELQAAVQSKRQQGETQPHEQEQLRRVNELIKVYEKIVEGNYIDNLIKAQQEQTRAVMKRTFS